MAIKAAILAALREHGYRPNESVDEAVDELIEIVEQEAEEDDEHAEFKGVDHD